MRALSIPRAYAWAIMTGHVGHYRPDGRIMTDGPALIYAGEDRDPMATDVIIALVETRSSTATALLLNSLHLVQTGTIIGAATFRHLRPCPTPDRPDRCTYEITNPRRAYPAAPCPAGAGLFTVPDDVLARLDIPGYVEGA